MIARKVLLACFFILALTVLACDIPGILTSPTNTPLPPTETSTATVTPTETPTITPTARTLAVVPAPSIVEIDMLDLLNGWAIGVSNVLITSDGGVTWYDATPPGVASVGHLASPYFMDAQNAWVHISSDTTNVLYRTSDGGVNWTTYTVPFSGGFLQFLDASNGWMLSTLGAGAGSEAVAIYQTANGGATWTQVYINDPTVPGAGDTLPLVGQKSGMTFLNSTRGWVGGNIPMDGAVYLYVTQDGGPTWAQQSLTLPGGFETAMTEVDAPHFFSLQNGILRIRLLSGVPSTVFYVTFDGGLTWAHTFPINAIGSYSCASLLDVFLWDGGGSLLVSHDSGLTWTSLTPSVSLLAILSQIDFINATTGWALTGDASGHHSLYQTIDGGATWSPLIP